MSERAYSVSSEREFVGSVFRVQCFFFNKTLVKLQMLTHTYSDVMTPRGKSAIIIALYREIALVVCSLKFSYILINTLA